MRCGSPINMPETLDVPVSKMTIGNRHSLPDVHLHNQLSPTGQPRYRPRCIKPEVCHALDRRGPGNLGLDDGAL